MANNIAISPGSGETLATDQTTISATSVQVQRVTTGAAPNLAYGNIAATTSATIVVAANPARKGLLVKSVDGTVYIGDASVTTGTGMPLGAGDPLTSVAYLGAVYARTASGTVNLRYWEES